MCVLARRLSVLILGVSAVLGPLAVSARAQAPAAPQVGVGPPVGVSPLTPLGVNHPMANVAVLGGRVGAGLGYGAGLNTGLGYGSLAASYAGSGLGYGSLANGYGYGGGIGSIALGTAAAGYGYSYGMGMYGTQWMQNPYSGYLRGAASITEANADWQLKIQQAKLQREEARRSVLRTRREALEEAEYERAHMPDPEKIRQEQIQRELDHARVAPPLTEVWSGRALNVLLRHLVAQQYQGARGPNIPLNEDVLKSINLTGGDTRGNVGLIKEGGNNLQWPQPLQGEAFKEAREDFARRLKHAVSTVQLNRTPDESTVNDLQADLQSLNNTVDANVSAMSPDQYTEAKRFVRLLGNTVTALKDRNVANYLPGGAWTAKGKSVAELIKFMGEKGLWFAPATPSDEPAYLALYHAMAAFDAGMPRTVSNSNPPAGGNGPAAER